MSSKENEPIIELKSVTKRYGFGESETLALNNFDLSVKKGEFIMIMGPSGCGKTTLLNIIGLLDKTTSGKYLLNGKPVSQISARKKAHFRAKEIGFIFQSFNLIPNLNVIENVSLPLTYCDFSKTRRLKKADAILERFHLREREYYMPHQLSGGQQQRVAIARSLAADPSIILADEPTGNLDSRSSHIIMEELKQIHSQGNTIIMVTHNPALTTYATRVINMLDGQIDTDIKTVDDKDLPHTNSTEKIAVRILTQKPTPEISVISETPVVVTGTHTPTNHTQSMHVAAKDEKVAPKKRPLGETATAKQPLTEAKPIEKPSRKRKIPVIFAKKTAEEKASIAKAKKEKKAERAKNKQIKKSIQGEKRSPKKIAKKIVSKVANRSSKKEKK